MIIGIPKERKTLEKRIALTPDGAHELVKHGHTVLVEQDAGLGSFFENQAYISAGATIVPTLKEVWTKAELVVKVKEPHESEYEFFRPGLMLFDYLHLASMPDVAKAMINGKITGIAYELVQTHEHRLPLLEPMSEVAGKLSVLNGAFFLLSQNEGRGLLLGGVVGVPPADVVIIGAGISGRAACNVALGMGAMVTILDIDYAKLDRIEAQFGNRARTVFSNREALAREVKRADLLIGAVLSPGAAAPKLVTRKMIKSMNKGSVFVDISIDQGGCAETIRPTSLDNPVYVEEGVTHYGVCNMPAQTPRTSTMALTAATLPYILKIADNGFVGAMANSQELRGALNTHQGALTNKAVSQAVGIRYTPIENALG
jgi:alanine dehydrogenase